MTICQIESKGLYWKDIFYGVIQGSKFGSLLFNIHLCDPFYFLRDLDIVNYVDTTTIYTVTEKQKESVNSALKYLHHYFLDGLVATL